MKTQKLVWLLPCLLFAASANAAETNTLKTQVELLMQRVKTLEYQHDQGAVIVTTVQSPLHDESASARMLATTTAENTGNPSISVIGTFSGSTLDGDHGVQKSNFLPLSEGEFVFGAIVDAHTRLDITVTAPNGGGMAVEEGYLTASLPKGFRMRAGRKFLPLGLVNEVHPHALVYADTPNGLVNLFGAEKLIGEGIFIDHPLYIGDSVHSLLFGFFQNANNVAFDPTGNNHFGGMVHWTGIWDIDDTTTAELGSTLVRGRNGITGSSRTDISGIQLALKNKQFDHSGWSLQGEWNQSRIDQGSNISHKVTDTAYLLGEYDFNRNWLTFARYDYSRRNGGVSSELAYSTGIGWKMSEFQSITLQYKHTRNALVQTATNLGIAAGQSANEVFFRWVVAIGPHRPHSY